MMTFDEIWNKYVPVAEFYNVLGEIVDVNGAGILIYTPCTIPESIRLLFALYVDIVNYPVCWVDRGFLIPSLIVILIRLAAFKFPLLVYETDETDETLIVLEVSVIA